MLHSKYLVKYLLIHNQKQLKPLPSILETHHTLKSCEHLPLQSLSSVEGAPRLAGRIANFDAWIQRRPVVASPAADIWGVPQSWGYPNSWMVFVRENLIKNG